MGKTISALGVEQWTKIRKHVLTGIPALKVLITIWTMNSDQEQRAKQGSLLRGETTGGHGWKQRWSEERYERQQLKSSC